MVTILDICRQILRLFRSVLAQQEANAEALTELQQSVTTLTGTVTKQAVVIGQISVNVDQIVKAVQMERGQAVSLHLSFGNPVPQ